MDLLPWQLEALNTFWLAQGVQNAKQRARLVSLANEVLLFRSPADLQQRLHQLRTSLWHVSGIADPELGVMVARYPRVLCGCALRTPARRSPCAHSPSRSDLAVALPPRLRALEKGLPGIDLRRLLHACPQLLSLSLVVPRAHELAALLGPEADVLRMCEQHPQLLTVSVADTCAPALHALREMLAAAGGQEAAAVRMVGNSPRLLTSRPETMRERAALLERLAPGTLSAATPSVAARLLCASVTALRRIAFLDDAHPGAGLSPVRAVSMPAAAFAKRFPGFEAWLQRQVA